LRQVAVMALERRRRPAGEENLPVRAPIPGHAAALMGRLMAGEFSGLGELKEALADAHAHPESISWPARAIQMAVSVPLLLPGLLMMFLVGPTLMWGAALVCAIGKAQVQARIEEKGAAEEDRKLLLGLERQREAVLGSSGWLREGIDSLEDAVRNADEEEAGPGEGPFPDAEDMTGGPAALLANNLSMLWWLAGPLFAWPLAWAITAALTGGGLSRLVVGIQLLDEQGQPAARWRIHLRTIVVWLPVAALLGLSLLVDLLRLARAPEAGAQPILGWVSWLSWWAALGLLPAYAWIMIQTPNHAWHDRIAGTYPVPG
jgi:hypothetical protein